MIKIKNLQSLDIFKITAHNIAKQSAGQVSDEYHFYSDMTPAEDGLFDQNIFGSADKQTDSDKFAHINLEMPVVVAGTDGKGFCKTKGCHRFRDRIFR